MESRPPLFRRKFLINRKFQLGLIAYFQAFIVINSSALYWFLKATFSAAAAELSRISPSQRSTYDLMEAGFQDLLFRSFLLFTAAGIVFAFFGGILVSHRIAGPLYRLEKLMTQASQGEVPSNVNCRKNDYFREVFTSLSRLLQYFYKRKDQ